MITKEIVIDKIEILEDGTIQIREKTRFLEDGVNVSESNTDRRVFEPGDDVSNENDEIKNIAALVHTSKRIAATEAKKDKYKDTIAVKGVS